MAISRRKSSDLPQDLCSCNKPLRPVEACHVLDLLLPPVCVACRRLLRGPQALPMCSLCRPEHQPLPPALRHVDGIEAVHAYQGPLARAMTALKYEGQLELAGPLGRLLAGADLLRRDWDAVIPVPLHRWRALLRGYNQAALLARWALPAGQRARPRWLRRVRATAPQTAQDAAARRQNLRDAFTAAPVVAGLRLLVIDDVTTTGATLQACLQALRAAGAREAAGLALLRSLA
jgi:ComF family protein